MLQTLRRRPLAAALPLSLAFLSGCDVQFPEQEVRMQYDTEADTLDVLFIYKGVHTPETSAEALNDGKNVADRILAGRREFMLLDWPYLWDLDELAEVPLDQLLKDRREKYRRVAALPERFPVVG